MKKILAVVLVVLSSLVIACGSSISDNTRNAASEHIGKIASSLTNAIAALQGAGDPASVNTVFSNFSATLSALVAAEAELAKDSGYSLVAQDKVLREKIGKLEKVIINFTNTVSGNNKDVTLQPLALDAGLRILTLFTNASFAPIEWIRACDEARGMIFDLTKLMESTYKALQDAKNGKAAGDALIAYADSVKALSERGQILEKRYPFFKKAATDPSLEKPVADFRSSMVKLGNELKAKEKAFKDDKEFTDALKQMKDNLTSLKK